MCSGRKTEDRTFFFIQVKYLFSVQLILSIKIPSKEKNQTISWQDFLAFVENWYVVVTTVRSGHRTAHQPFLPKSNQPLKPLLFCFRLLDEQLKDKGERKKSRHNALTFSLFVIIH